MKSTVTEYRKGEIINNSSGCVLVLHGKMKVEGDNGSIFEIDLISDSQAYLY